MKTKKNVSPFSRYVRKSVAALLLAMLVHSNSVYTEAGSFSEGSLGSGPNREYDNAIYAVNFVNTPITDYIINFVSKVTHKNFIFNEEELRDIKLTLISPEGTTVDNIMASLTQILRIRGFSILEQGNNLIIYKGANSPLSSEVITEDGSLDEKGYNALIATKIFRVSILDINKIETLLKPLLSPNAVIVTSAETQQFIITDIYANLHKVEKLLSGLDQTDLGEIDTFTYKPTKAPIKTLYALARKIIASYPNGNLIQIETNETNNTLFVAGPRLSVKKVYKVLKTLDLSSDNLPTAISSSTTEGESTIGTVGEPIDEFNSGFYVHKLQYHSGEAIKKSITDMTQKIAATGAIEKDVTATLDSVQWVESTNSLLFAGNRNALKKAVDFVKQIDVVQKQVYIEVLAIRTTLNNALNFGVTDLSIGGLSLNDANARNWKGFDFNTPVTDGVRGNRQLFSGDKEGVITGASANLPLIGRLLRHKNGTFTTISGVISAIQTDVDSQILINPKILTHDNFTAQVNLTTTQKINATKFTTEVDDTTKGKSITSTEDFVTGNILNITPIIGNNGIITLDIDLDFSRSKSASDGPGSKSSTITKTRVHVPNNQFLILSGQIQDDQFDEQSKVPILGSIPILGNLFKNTNKGHIKDNMMIFIRPHIVENAREATELSRKQRSLLRKNSEKKGTKAKNTFDATLKFLELDDLKP